MRREGVLANEIVSASGADESDYRITLGILTTVADASAVSQRALAKELGIALGLANAYVKRCVRTGLVKMRGAPANRCAYYLTPEGFAEKSRLTARYLARSFQFYRDARNQIDGCLATCVERGYERVALCGAGELAEIAVVVAMQHSLTLVAVLDERPEAGSFLSLSLIGLPASTDQIHTAILTDLVAPQRSFRRLRLAFDDKRILVPPILNVSRQMNCGPGPT